MAGTINKSQIHLYGRSESANAYMIRDFLHRSDVPFDWIEAGADAPKGDFQCEFPDGTKLYCPSIHDIVEKLGWFHDPCRAQYDLAIYGAGPAGLSAAVYGASEGLSTVLIERSALGGQAGSSSRIENYLGFPDGISGADLADRARKQAMRFGAEILIGREGVRGEFTPGKGVGFLKDGTKIIARATICATGVDYRRLNLPNEARLLGAGVYYGAGVSEASLCEKDDEIFVVGGGNSAGQAVMYFSAFVKSVTMVVRGPCLKKTLSQYLVDRVQSAKNVRVMVGCEVTSVDGGATLETLSVTNRKTGEKTDYKTHRLFVCIGGSPHTGWAEDVGIVRDDDGYLVTGQDLMHDNKPPTGWPLDRAPYFLETSMPGVFAAGDVRHGSVKRCASAVGEGAMAVAFVHRYLAGR